MTSHVDHVIDTPRLEIKRFKEEFLTSRYINWLNDKEVMKYSEQRHRTHTIETCREYYQSFKDTPNILWAISVKDGDVGHIGNATAYIDIKHSVADVGILIGERQVWGQGFGYEAWMGICDYLFRVQGLRKITAGAISTNARMLTVMRKAGMISDGTRVKHYVWEGQEVDICHFALFQTDWCEMNPEGPF